MRRLSLRIDDADADRLAAEAARRGMSEAEVIRLALQRLLEDPAPAAAAPAPAATPASTFGTRVEELKRNRRLPL